MENAFENDSWSIVDGTIDDRPVVIRMRERLPSAEVRASLPSLLIITWTCDANESGMPAEEVNAQMNLLEDALESGLEARGVGVKVLALTGNGHKEWRYYAADADAFLNSLNEDLAGHEPYPIKIEVFDDPDWNGLDEFVSAVSEGE